VPGPGTYNARESLTRDTARAFSILPRVTSPDDSRYKPGPGTYEGGESFRRLHASRSYSLGGKLDTKHRSASPGAIYQLPADKGRAFSFGRLIPGGSASGLPGPGAYEVSATTLGYASRRM